MNGVKGSRTKTGAYEGLVMDLMQNDRPGLPDLLKRVSAVRWEIRPGVSGEELPQRLVLDGFTRGGAPP